LCAPTFTEKLLFFGSGSPESLVSMNRMWMFRWKGIAQKHAQLKLFLLLLKVNFKVNLSLIRPTLTYGSECWPHSKKDWNKLRICERRILKIIYGPLKVNGIWRTVYSNELYTLCDELDIVKVIKIGRLRWLGHLIRIQKLDPCRKLTVLKPEGTRRVGKPKLRWLESTEEDINKMGMRSWRRQYT
jgi:hypothetical protein